MTSKLNHIRQVLHCRGNFQHLFLVLYTDITGDEGTEVYFIQINQINMWTGSLFKTVRPVALVVNRRAIATLEGNPHIVRSILDISYGSNSTKQYPS